MSQIKDVQQNLGDMSIQLKQQDARIKQLYKDVVALTDAFNNFFDAVAIDLGYEAMQQLTGLMPQWHPTNPRLLNTDAREPIIIRNPAPCRPDHSAKEPKKRGYGIVPEEES